MDKQQDELIHFLNKHKNKSKRATSENIDQIHNNIAKSKLNTMNYLLKQLIYIDCYSDKFGEYEKDRLLSHFTDIKDFLNALEFYHAQGNKVCDIEQFILSIIDSEAQTK